MALLAFLSILLLCLFIRSFRIERALKVLLYIYVVYWGMGIFFSSFGFYGIKEPGNYAQFLLLLHLFGFVLGVYFYSTINRQQKLAKNISNNDIGKEIESFLTSRLFWILFALSFAYVLSLFQTYMTSLVFYGRSGEIRQNIEDIYGSFYKFYGNELLIQPIKILCFPLLSYALINRRILETVVLGLYLVMEATLAGGRFGYAYIVVAFYFINVIILKANLKKYTPYFIVVILLFFIASSYTKATRMGYTDFSINNIVKNGMSANAEQIVTYYTGPMAAFDYSLKNNYIDKIGGLQYGALTFSPIIMAIHTVGTLLNFDFHVPIVEVYGLLEYNQVDIGADYWNAFFTSVIYYYMDMGVVGVFVFPFLIGILFSFLMKKLLLRPSVWIASISCMFYIYLIKSEMKLEIISGKLFIVYIIYYLLGQRYMRNRKKQFKIEYK